MRTAETIYRIWREHRLGWIVVALSGPLLLALPFGDSLTRLSYDLPFLVKPKTPQTDVAILYVDEPALKKLGRELDGTLNRGAHEQLLLRLADGRPRVVFYDFVFLFSNHVAAVDQALARAIRLNTNVVLASAYQLELQAGSLMRQELASIPILRAAAAASGPGTLMNLDADDGVRRLTTTTHTNTNAVWWAALRGRSPTNQLLDNARAERWLNYYGPPRDRDFPIFHYYNIESVLDPATDVASIVSNRVVLVGNLPTVDILGARKDTFRSPYSRFGYPDLAGIEAHATALANLLHDNWLTRVSLPIQMLFALCWGVGLSWLCLTSRRSKTAWLIPIVVLILIVGSCWAQLSDWRLWWSWMIPVAAQTPLALIWFVFANPRPIGPPIAFISYRRETGGETARLIRGALRERRQNAFLDVEDLPGGLWDERLLEEIRHAPNFIVILAPGVLDRCTEPGDFVRREIAHAIAHRRLIVPILKDGFRFPPPETLPEDIRALGRWSGVEYSHKRFDATMAELRDKLVRRPPRPGRDGAQ